MTKAITTRYVAATKTKKSRVRAEDLDGNSITLEWNRGWTAQDNHLAACRALCTRMFWEGDMVCAYGRGCVVWVWDGGEKFTMPR